jgi:hypothetical protein
MLAWAELIPDDPVDPLDRQGIETEGQQLPVALFWRYQPRFLRRQRLVDRTLRGFDAGRMVLRPDGFRLADKARPRSQRPL